MLTLCARCRTPYDRRLVDGGALPTGDAVVCATCRSGSSADTRVPVLVALPALAPTEGMPATVLPVAS